MSMRIEAFVVVLLVAVVLGWSAHSHAQAVPVPNPSFETGTAGPDGWRLADGEGKWLDSGAASGKRAIAVTGNGDDAHEWRSDALPLAPTATYRLRFRARSLDGRNGTAVSGAAFCNRDLGDLKPEWEQFTSYFAAPEPVTPDATYLRFGEWHVKGAVAFDDIELTTAEPIYATESGIELGDGEAVDGTAYTFEPNWSSTLSNQSRPLARFRGNFNTNRWMFGQDSELVYRQRVGERRQLKANIEVALTNYGQGTLEAQASNDAKTWRDIGSAHADGSQTWAIPADLFPATDIWIRLRASGPASFTLASYRFKSALDGTPLGTLRGSTRYAVVTQIDPRLAVKIAGLGEGLPGGKNEVALMVTNRTNAAVAVTPTVTLRDAGEANSFISALSLAPGEQSVRIPYEVADAGVWTLQIDLGKSASYAAETSLQIPDLYAVHYGESLPGSSGTAELWWANSGWKISRTRPAPTTAGTGLRISLARNEVEAAQLVIRPKAKLTRVTLTATALSGPSGGVIPAAAIEFLRERYLNVQQATDSAGAAGLWPDPLPPVAGPVDLEANVNHPFWVRVKAPRGIAAGAYSGSIHVAADGFTAEAPLTVEVYDFDLPDRMTCVTAFGFSPENVYQYQKLSTPEQKRAVLEKYLADFASHHITPYNPAPLDDFKVTWPTVTATTAPADLKPAIDWSAWDAAMDRAYHTYHFNSFMLPSPGMGGGTFHDRVEPDIQGFKENTPQYQALFASYYGQVQEHLRAKGWLNDAYVYWFDEPDPKDYDFVMNGFRKLKTAVPDIPRMLTEQVEPQLVGGPNIWCPISNEYQHAAAETQRAKGDRFWWYICTGPKAPYCTEFIDHPATELRVWLWQTWQRNITGALIWQTNYWTSSTAYVDPAHPQNPYDDPMSWTVGYGTPAGSRIPWGNGDGRFIYPPEAAASGQQPQAVLEGPVDSIRWEMLRDGIEDYEYMVILRAALKTHGASLPASELASITELLTVPPSITSDVTHFTRDPRPIEEHRVAVAHAIERLSRR